MNFTTQVLASLLITSLLTVVGSGQESSRASGEPEVTLESRLALAGGNKAQLVKAIESAPENQRAAVEFLVLNMPRNDLRSLSAEFLLEHVRVAFEARSTAPWAEQISDELFLNDILPYANVDETRESWRAELREICLPIVKDCKTAGEAAHELNTNLFREVKVKYSRKRKKANQSPSESIDTGLASCTGLSILLADACRSVHVPARLTGIPSWTNKRGNHTWVEVWDNADNDWHFAGAAEADPAGLDRGWFVRDASLADKAKRMNSIYSISFARTDTVFPMVWSRDRENAVYAVNVTDRYAKPKDAPDAAADPDKIQVRIRVWNADRTERVATNVLLVDPAADAGANDANKLSGTSPSNTADMNNMLEFALDRDTQYELHIGDTNPLKVHPFTSGSGDTQLIEVRLDVDGEPEQGAKKHDAGKHDAGKHDDGTPKHTNRQIKGVKDK